MCVHILYINLSLCGIIYVFKVQNIRGGINIFCSFQEDQQISKKMKDFKSNLVFNDIIIPGINERHSKLWLASTVDRFSQKVRYCTASILNSSERIIVCIIKTTDMVSCRFAFQYNPALQPRAIIVFGCISKTVTDSEIKQLLKIMMKVSASFSPQIPWALDYYLVPV